MESVSIFKVQDDVCFDCGCHYAEHPNPIRRSAVVALPVVVFIRQANRSPAVTETAVVVSSVVCQSPVEPTNENTIPVSAPFLRKASWRVVLVANFHFTRMRLKVAVIGKGVLFAASVLPPPATKWNGK